MANFSTDIVIIGAGVIGLATARTLSEYGKEVLVLEELSEFGKITSSRNSGVIHAGIYYPENSLKAKMCVEGNKLLYEYCNKYSIPHKNTKKILVASSEDQVKIIDDIKVQAEKNSVQNIEKISKSKVSILEPLIECKEALLIPTSGIIDSYSLMNSLEGQIKDAKGMIAYNSKVSKINFDGKFFTLQIQDQENNITSIRCKYLINSAGLYASKVANSIEELNKKFIPKTYYAKGNYFSLSRDLGIKHLIYPIPEGFGLGIHLTLEMDNTIKFGPDVEWIEDIDDYEVNDKSKERFTKEILKYLPSLKANLLVANYSGIRPIMNKKDKSMRDFTISTEQDHNISGLINLYGIESPGLTSSLSLAKHIAKNFF
jgi:L-2-hydroxyglutarate oxidase LhgO